MAKVIVFLSLTLDGVMQGPGRPDEDTRGGFKYSGWAAPYSEPSIGKAVGESMTTTGGLLFGRRTYEDFYDYWPKRNDGNPFTEVLNNMQKYVASTKLKAPLPWMNSTLLKGSVPKAVAKLKRQEEKDFVILGSGKLVHSLMEENLIDRYMLLIHPLVLGTGKRLFPNSAMTALKLVNTETTGKGVIITTYEPVNGTNRTG